MNSTIDHPAHYQHPSGVEAIDLCERLGFNLGNAYKYLARAGKKGDRAEDLRKAAWYLRRESAWLRDRCISVDMAPGLRTLANRVLQSGATDVAGAFRDMLRAIALHEELWHDDLAGLAEACEREAAS